MSAKLKKALALILAFIVTVSTVATGIPGGAKKVEAAASSEFVSANGEKFSYQGGDYYFGGGNCYYLMFKTDKDIENLFQGAHDMGVSVIRTWAFLDVGTKQADGTFTNNADGAGQKDGVYFRYFDADKNEPVINEDEKTGIARLDKVVQLAEKYDIKLIFTLTNEWEAFGGMSQMARWAGYTNVNPNDSQQGDQNTHDKFYTDKKCKQWYKDYIKYLANRTNIYTNKKYKDDPTIFAWELANEPRGKSDAQCKNDTLYNWVDEMSTYIKSVDSNHMVAIGDEGFFNYAADDPFYTESGESPSLFLWNGGEGCDFEKMINLPNVDFATPHLYIGDWNLTKKSSVDNWIKHHAEVAHEAGKPIILEEFGWAGSKESQVYPSMTEYYEDIYGQIEKYNYAGSTVWMLASYVENEGGPYTNYDGYNVYVNSYEDMKKAFPNTPETLKDRDPIRTILIDHCKTMAAKSNNNAVNPSSTTADLASAKAVTVELKLQDGAELSKLTMNGKELTKGTDYTISGTTVTFPASFVSSLEEGDNYVTFVCSQGKSPELKITVSNSSVTGAKVAVTDYNFDKNPKTAKSIAVSVTINDAGDLKDVKLRGKGSERTSLKKGTNYTYSASGQTGTVTLLKSYLSTLTGDSAVFELDYEQGTDPVITVKLKDTTGTDSIDDFESYNDDSALGSAYGRNQYGGGITTTLTSDVSGSKAMKYEYSTGDSGYAGVTKSIGSRDLSSFDGVQMWYKPDGSGNKLTIQMKDSADNYWEYYITLSGTEAQTIKMPFSDFRVKSGYGDENATIGASPFTEFSIYVDKTADASEGSLYFDDIEIYVEGGNPDPDPDPDPDPSTDSWKGVEGSNYTGTPSVTSTANSSAFTDDAEVSVDYTKNATSDSEAKIRNDFDSAKSLGGKKYIGFDMTYPEDMDGKISAKITGIKQEEEEEPNPPEPVEVKVTGVTLDSTTASLTVGDTKTLTATVAPSDATNKSVTWSSDNEQVATVNNGTITAVAKGTATITVTTADGNKEATCTVTVTEKSTPTPSKDGLYVDGAYLYSAKGQKIAMRGTNVAHVFFQDRSKTDIAKNAEVGANAVRIVLGDGYPAANGWTAAKNTVSDIEPLVKLCREKGMVAVLDDQCTTGGDDTYYLERAVSYFIEMKDMLNRYQDCVIVNIANEWSGKWVSDNPNYVSAYQKAIKDIRDAGIKNVIMIDAAGWGQDIEGLAEVAGTLKAADTTGNIMFSGHMYCYGAPDTAGIKSRVDSFVNKGLCFCVGEFGWKHQYNGASREIDYNTIMSYCSSKDVGWLAWSWYGNGAEGNYLAANELDIVNSDNSPKGQWGSDVFKALAGATKVVYDGDVPASDDDNNNNNDDNNNDNTTTSGALSIKGKDLVLGNGEAVALRGVNINHAWYKDRTTEAIKKSASLGSNCARLVMSDGTCPNWKSSPESASSLETLIKTCRDNGQIAVVEIHDGTGFNDTKYIDSAVNYWISVKDVLNKYTDCCIVNIANEWSGSWLSSNSSFTSTYKSAIQKLRQEGIKNVIMVDAPGWGQDIMGLASVASEIKSADSTGNTMFSGHMYCYGAPNESGVKQRIDAFADNNLCFCVGEFGWRHKGDNGAQDIPYEYIMSYCQQKGVSWLAWSWYGNGAEGNYLQQGDLDLVDASNNLKDPWGKKVAEQWKGSRKLTFSANIDNSVRTASADKINIAANNAIRLAGNDSEEKLITKLAVTETNAFSENATLFTEGKTLNADGTYSVLVYAPLGSASSASINALAISLIGNKTSAKGKIQVKNVRVFDTLPEVDTPVDVTGITLNKTTLSLKVKETATLTATVAPEDATDKTVTWASNNEEVATVNNGKVTAVAKGTAKITAKAGNKTATCTVTVTEGTTEPIEDSKSWKGVEGENYGHGSASSTNAKPEVTSSANGTAIDDAKVSVDYTANADGESEARIRNDFDSSYSLDGKKYIGYELTYPKEMDGKISSKITGTKKGTEESTTQEPTTEGPTTEEPTTEEPGPVDPIEVTSVTLNKETVDLKEGETATLTATVAPENADDKTVTWSTSDKAVATVKDGVITAVKAGTATITAKAGSKTASCEVTVTAKPTPQPNGGMYVDGDKLYDASGNEFIMRGVNIPHAWYKQWTEQSINDVAALGSNAVRVVMTDGSVESNGGKTTVTEIQNIINWSKASGQICVLELHDFTGDSDPADITTNCVNYWTQSEVIKLLNENKDYVILNIANEWFGLWDNMTTDATKYTWRDTYKTAVKALRDAGIENVIMIDAAGYGNDITTVTRDAQDVLKADTTGNTMFSYHMYSTFGGDVVKNKGGSGEAIKAGIDNLKETGVCFCIGEFGYWQNRAEVDERTLVDYSQENGIGWLAWSWAGNAGDDGPLDLTSYKTFSKDDLTDWGKWVFGTTNGIQETSVLAYTGKKFTGTKITGTPDSLPTPILDDTHDEKGDISKIDAGELGKMEWTEGIDYSDAKTWSIAQMGELENGGMSISNIDLSKENYPTFCLKMNGADLSAHKTLDVLVRNNSSYTLQLCLGVKGGEVTYNDGTTGPALAEAKSVDYNSTSNSGRAPYLDIPKHKTTVLHFSIDEENAQVYNGGTWKDIYSNVYSINLRVQAGNPPSEVITDSLDIISVGFDWPEGKFDDVVAELNRPKSATRWTWNDKDFNWGTPITYSQDNEAGTVTMNYSVYNNNSKDNKGTGIQAQTNPGGSNIVGEDWTPYKSVTATLKNTSDKPVHVTFLCRNGSNWTWAENSGYDAASGRTPEEECILGTNETVNVRYVLNEATWRTENSKFAPTDSLKELDIVKCVAFKVYAGEGDGTVTGTLEISNFEVHFEEDPSKTTSQVINNNEVKTIAANNAIRLTANNKEENLVSRLAAQETTVFSENAKLYTAGKKDNGDGTYTVLVYAPLGTAASESIDALTISLIGNKLNAKGTLQVKNVRVFDTLPVVDDPVEVESITLDRDTASVVEGKTTTLTATVAPDNATDKTVTWTSSDETVATVVNGKVTGVKEGTVTITAKAGDKKATCEVTVIKADQEIAVTGVTLNYASASVTEGKTVTLEATVTPANATDPTVTWTTSDKTVATVANGVVTGVKEGTAKITATAGGKKATCTITVTKGNVDPDIIPVEAVQLDNASVTIAAGNNTKLIATVEPENATDKSITWASDNEDVAVVTSSGKVAALKEGTAVITATAGGVTAKCTVTVTKAVDPEPNPDPGKVSVNGVSIDNAKLDLMTGEDASLKATVLPKNADNQNVSWESSDDTIVSVEDMGGGNAVITANNKEGTATITVITEDGGFKASCKVTVTKQVVDIPVSGVELDQTKLTITVGNKKTITPKVLPTTAKNQNVTFESSDDTVARVDKYGRITALKEGTATITVITEDGGFKADCKVTVEPEPEDVKHVTGVTISAESDTIYVGKTTKVTATVTPADATDKTVDFVSSDKKIATVAADGTVTGIKAGKVTITAITSDGDKTAEVEITVTANSEPVTDVTISSAAEKMTVGGEKLKLTATVEPENATVKDVIWESTNPSVATVSKDGQVTAISSGYTYISATTVDGNFTAMCKVTVVVPVDSIIMNPESAELVVGQTKTLTAIVQPDDATDQNVLWTSEKPAIASVDKYGKVTAVSAGTVKIKATAMDGKTTAVCEIQVVNAELPKDTDFQYAWKDVKFDKKSEWSEILDKNGNKAEISDPNLTTNKIPEKGFKVTAKIKIPGVKDVKPDFDGAIKVQAAARLGENWNWVSSQDIKELAANSFKWDEESGCYVAPVEVTFGDNVEAYDANGNGGATTYEEAFKDKINAVTLTCAGYKCDYEGNIYVSDLKLDGVKEVNTPDEPKPIDNQPTTQTNVPADQQAIEEAKKGTVSLAESEAVLNKTNTDKKDPSDSTFAKLKLKAQGKKKSVKLSWSKVSGAEGYMIYGAACGQKMKRITTVSGSKKSYTAKSLKAGKYYKYVVKAYKTVAGEQRVITTSKSVHATTDGGKYTNPTKITVKSSTIKLKKGKTTTLQPKLTAKKTVKTHIAKFRYESDNTKIATVNSKGKVKAVKKGSCNIYIYAQNGVYKKVKIKVN